MVQSQQIKTVGLKNRDALGKRKAEQRETTYHQNSREERSLRTSVSYLGIHFDEELRVNAHFAVLKEKYTSQYNTLAKVARSTWGLGHWCMRALYRGLFVPTITYAAATWFDPLNRTAIQALRAIQRHAILRVTKAYRTVSADTLPVIAEVLRSR